MSRISYPFSLSPILHQEGEENRHSRDPEGLSSKCLVSGKCWRKDSTQNTVMVPGDPKIGGKGKGETQKIIGDL